ncbi:MAG: DNA recombination protein RmuC [Chitinophagales bacterium]|nr:DNA recombination protein RmuC [Chitinophagales bacterium]MDW8272633.1 DNA recombination protein RmuC [Chitinophagales bacterium]
MIELIYLIVGIALGSLLGYLLSRYFMQKKLSEFISKSEYEKLLSEKNAFAIECARANEHVQMLQSQIESVQQELKTEREKSGRLSTELTTAQSRIENLREKLEVHKQEVAALQEQFKTDFKNIANELLEDKSRKFTQQNQEKINEILQPLSQKIKDFEQKVEQTYRDSLEKNAGLLQQIKDLKELNLQITKEAHNLAVALKGESKTRGNWGEMILEKILERSGLQRDVEYAVQKSVTDESGRRLQPDVVIFLPDNRNIIIDSKVSLSDYERFVSAETEEEKSLYLKKHIQSIRNHIKGLSEKNYHHLYGTASPDFVLMFVPVEPAFMLAVQHDQELFLDSFEKKIVLVSASTLLAVLRTVASIWRQENIARNHLEIAKQAGDLYDKFVGFTEDLLKLGKDMNSAKNAYDAAMKKLTDGSGNLVKRVEKIKELGAKASKKINTALLGRALED